MLMENGSFGVLNLKPLPAGMPTGWGSVRNISGGDDPSYDLLVSGWALIPEYFKQVAYYKFFADPPFGGVTPQQLSVELISADEGYKASASGFFHVSANAGVVVADSRGIAMRMRSNFSTSIYPQWFCHEWGHVVDYIQKSFNSGLATNDRGNPSSGESVITNLYNGGMRAQLIAINEYGGTGGGLLAAEWFAEFFSARVRGDEGLAFIRCANSIANYKTASDWFETSFPGWAAASPLWLAGLSGLREPVFTVQPVSATVAVSTGTAVNFTAIAYSNPAPTYQWWFQAGGIGGVSQIAGATTNSYGFTATNSSQNGNYILRATIPGGAMREANYIALTVTGAGN